MNSSHCLDHSGIAQSITNIEESAKRNEKDIKTLEEGLTTLISKQNTKTTAVLSLLVANLIGFAGYLIKTSF